MVDIFDNAMNKQEDTLLLSRYLDGELSTAEKVLVKKRLLAEMDLAEEYRRLKAVNDLLVKSFASNDAKTVPPKTAAMMGPFQLTMSNRNENSMWQFASAAAVVAAVGLLIIRGWNVSPAGHPVIFEQDQLISKALEQTPSSASNWVVLEDSRKLRPVLTFPHENGGWCREYELATVKANWKGIACRAGDTSWITQAIGDHEAIRPVVNKYRPAGADVNGKIGNFVKEHASDIPLSVKQELLLINAGWNR